MSNDINLFQQTTANVPQSLAKGIRTVRIVALSFLFIVPTAAVIIFLLIFFSPQTSLQQQESVLLTKANALGNKVAETSFINDRIVSSVKFMTARSIYGKTLRELVLQLPSGVVIDTLNMQKNSITLEVESSSLTSLETYQKSLLAVPQSSQFLRNISFHTLQLLTDSSKYQMTLQAIIHE